jgi:hypothetical protein
MQVPFAFANSALHAASLEAHDDVDVSVTAKIAETVAADLIILAPRRVDSVPL